MNVKFILHILLTRRIELAGLWKDLYVVYFMAVDEHLNDEK